MAGYIVATMAFALPRRLAPVAVGIATTLAATAAGAEPVATRPSARLLYERRGAGDACPDEHAFRALVTARLGQDPFTDAAERAVRIEIVAEGGRIAGRVEIAGSGAPKQERTVRGAPRDCEAVVEALASVVALSLAPPTSEPAPAASAVEPLPPLPPGPTPASVPTTASAPVIADRASERPTEEQPASPLRFAARAALVTSLGLLPAAAVGGEAGAGLARGWFSLYLMGRAEAQPGHARGVSGERLDGAVFSGGALPCFTAGWFSGCASIWVGALQGRAPDAVTPSLGSSVVGYGGARALAAIPLGAGLHLAPQVEAWVPFVRTTLVYATAPTWTAPAIVASFGLGLTYVPSP